MKRTLGDLMAFEVNFDGIVGPTHNYAGLASGNLASAAHRKKVSSPKRAALQGLSKMKFVHNLGMPQAVLPPLRRPRLDVLRDLGFVGQDQQIIESAAKHPTLLAGCYSASNMWVANAATISPSADCQDGRVHLTPANLASAFHRSLEAVETTAMLRFIFGDADRFRVHDPLPCNMAMTDEGAANHTRLCRAYGERGVEMFVFGRSAQDAKVSKPAKFPARQTLEASQALARRHGLSDSAVVFAQQSPEVIDAGVFHNDVISVGNQNVLLLHEMAFVDSERLIEETKRKFRQTSGSDLFVVSFDSAELPVSDAVASYLFNSQLLAHGDTEMTLICPLEVKENAAAAKCVERLLAEDNPVCQVHYLDLRQSMNNGGGPACLRLRIVLTESEWQNIHPGVRFDDALCEKLEAWVQRHYRDELSPQDLQDPQLVVEVCAAFKDLAEVLQLPAALFRL